MRNSKYLSEENYQRSQKKISRTAWIVLLIGLLVGGSLIAMGVKKQSEINHKYSDENKEELLEQIAAEKEELEAKIADLEAKGIEYDSGAGYTDGEAYDLKVLVKVLDPSFDYWKFDEYKDNALTAEYCSLKEQYRQIDQGFGAKFESSDYVHFYAFGGMAILMSCAIAGMITMVAKRRDIMAFSMQQSMPVMQETLENMMPVAQRNFEKMAPYYQKVATPMAREFAKEMAKGFKEGWEDDTQ